MKKNKMVVLGGLVVLSLAFFIVVEGDYREHQNPIKFNCLTLEEKGELHRISTLLGDIEKISADEDKEIYLAFKTKGQIIKKTRTVMFDQEYQNLLTQRKEILNPQSRKNEGFGFKIYKFLGIVS